MSIVPPLLNRIAKWDGHYPAVATPKRLIVVCHGYGQGFAGGVDSDEKRRLLLNIRSASGFDWIAEECQAIVLYPYAVGFNWRTRPPFSWQQTGPILARVREELSRWPEMEVYFAGFSDGGTMAHLLARQFYSTAGVIIYSAPIRHLTSPVDHRYRMLLVRNTQERVAGEQWRQAFVDFARANGLPHTSLTGDMPPHGVLGWHHFWDRALNPRIAAWIKGVAE